MARPFEGHRTQRRAEVDARYAAYLERGFPAEFDGVAETLQCRDWQDRTNWMGLLIKAQAMIAAGLGDEPCDPPIRTTENRMYAIPWSDVPARMYALLNQAGQAQANYWRLKDAVRDCPSREGLAAINLEEGWP